MRNLKINQNGFLMIDFSNNEIAKLITCPFISGCTSLFDDYSYSKVVRAACSIDCAQYHEEKEGDTILARCAISGAKIGYVRGADKRTG